MVLLMDDAFWVERHSPERAKAMAKRCSMMGSK